MAWSCSPAGSGRGWRMGRMVAMAPVYSRLQKLSSTFRCKVDCLFGPAGKGEQPAHGQNVRFSLVRGVVESDGAVQAEEIGVAGLYRVLAFDAVDAAARDHFALPVQHQ